MLHMEWNMQLITTEWILIDRVYTWHTGTFLQPIRSHDTKIHYLPPHFRQFLENSRKFVNLRKKQLKYAQIDRRKHKFSSKPPSRIVNNFFHYSHFLKWWNNSEMRQLVPVKDRNQIGSVFSQKWRSSS